MATFLLTAAGCVLAASGVPGLVLGWRSPWGPRLATLAALLGALLGAAGCALALGGGAPDAFSGESALPGSRWRLSADALSGFFALPIFAVGALGSIYGLAYWKPAERPRNGRRLRFCYGLLLASMTFVLLARDGAGFLVAWEAMALAGYFLVTTDSRSREARRAGWLYLVYSHAGTLCLVGFFALLAQQGGGFALHPLGREAAGPGAAAALFALAFLGFGIKAGAMPLHSWLPPAHASAPSHVSAVMSAVMLKMGIYGLVRAAAVLPSLPASWGVALLVVGATSCLAGVAFALAQRDLKRALAYSSTENVGIILLGLGLAIVGRASGRGDWVMLGLAGGLLHVWNHALFKALLFFGAGSVAHGSGTRDLELTGGLGRRMPATAALFLVGAVALCGLPPLNGFVSELFVYLGLSRAGLAPGPAWITLPVPALAAAGALAVACFVRLFGIAFLGAPRSAISRQAHESPALMLAPMALLATACVAVGVAPGLVAPAIERAVADWSQPAVHGAPAVALAALAPLGWISTCAIALLLAAALLAAALLPCWRRGRRRQPALPTWGCGFAGGSPRLQYTASSFSQLITSGYLWALRPRLHRPDVDGLFPRPARFGFHAGDPLLEDLLLPRARRLREVASRLRAYQQGNLQQYVLYIAIAVAVLLLLNLRLDWVVAKLCGR